MTKMNAAFLFQQSSFCPEHTVDAQQLDFWIYSSDFISRQQWQLTDLSVGELLSDAVGSIFIIIPVSISTEATSNYKKPPVCFWKCINHAAKSKHPHPKKVICLI